MLKKFWFHLFKKINFQLNFYKNYSSLKKKFILLKFPNFFFKKNINDSKNFLKTKKHIELFDQGYIVFFKNKKKFLFLDSSKYFLDNMEIKKNYELIKLSKKYSYFLEFGLISDLTTVYPDM